MVTVCSRLFKRTCLTGQLKPPCGRVAFALFYDAAAKVR
ncbi:hypothetical protein B0G69_7217 [Paraburkholderia sp. RAU2J]|nr:hypothetical protein B0G69_7217 [Paraburkholderia sp. RAU2J]